MKLISHRGNIDGPNPLLENNPEYINTAIDLGYDVEIDIWYYNNMLYSGHDEPQYLIDFTWLATCIDKLWIHCKNIEAVVFFTQHEYSYNYFWHDNDVVTLTSQKFIWAYPGNQPISNSIAVLPEINNDDITRCIGICTDYIKRYEK